MLFLDLYRLPPEWNKTKHELDWIKIDCMIYFIMIFFLSIYYKLIIFYKFNFKRYTILKLLLWSSTSHHLDGKLTRNRVKFLIFRRQSKPNRYVFAIEVQLFENFPQASVFNWSFSKEKLKYCSTTCQKIF